MGIKSIPTLAAALALFGAAPTTTWSADVEGAGDVVSVALPLAGFATATIKQDRKGQLQFLKSIATNAVITGALKRSVDKTRPDGDCCNSFPSSHTSFAFMGATFLQRRYGRNIGIPAYSAAAFVGYSRVAADRHFVEDVVAGAAIGYLSSWLFTTKYDALTVSPVVGQGFVGIAFDGSW